MDIDKLEPGMSVKTKGNDIVEVFTVATHNGTVSVGNSRKFPIIISADEIKEIVSK